MELLNKSSQRLIMANARVLTIPIVSLVAVLIMLVSIANYAVPKFKKDVEEINDRNQKIVVLEEKLEILRQIQESVLSSADVSLLALPSRDPTLWVLSQVNKTARDNNLVIIKRQADLVASDGSDISPFVLKLSLQGEPESAVKFMEEVLSLAPIMIPVEVNYKVSDTAVGGVSLNVSFAFYKSELPQTIPAIAQPIKNLTNEEISLLEMIYPLKSPEFTTLEAEGGGERVDPFN